MVCKQKFRSQSVPFTNDFVSLNLLCFSLPTRKYMHVLPDRKTFAKELDMLPWKRNWRKQLKPSNEQQQISGVPTTSLCWGWHFVGTLDWSRHLETKENCYTSKSFTHMMQLQQSLRIFSLNIDWATHCVSQTAGLTLWKAFKEHELWHVKSEDEKQGWGEGGEVHWWGELCWHSQPAYHHWCPARVFCPTYPS